jgi:hypothetical protein
MCEWTDQGRGLCSPAPDADVEAADDPVFLLGEAAVPDVRPEVVEPPQPAAFAAPVQPCKQRWISVSHLPSSSSTA